MFHTRYCPAPKLDSVRVSRTLLFESNTSIVWMRGPLLSQSSQYVATWCVAASLKFKAMVKLVREYQAAAIRSDAPTFCSARTSVVEEVHTYCDALVDGAA